MKKFILIIVVIFSSRFVYSQNPDTQIIHVTDECFILWHPVTKYNIGFKTSNSYFYVIVGSKEDLERLCKAVISISNTNVKYHQSCSIEGLVYHYTPFDKYNSIIVSNSCNEWIATDAITFAKILGMINLL